VTTATTSTDPLAAGSQFLSPQDFGRDGDRHGPSEAAERPLCAP